jgi:hypothetical protein
MATPDALVVTILHNDVDITSLCPYEEMDLDDSLSDVSRFSVLIQNPATVPVKDDTIFVYASERATLDTLFSGLIIEVEEIPRGVVRDYRCEVADNKNRLMKSIVPTKEYADIDTGILDEMLADGYPDLSDVWDFSFAESVSDVSQLLQANEDSLLDMLKALRDKTGAKMSSTRPPGRYVLDFDGGGNIDSGVGTYATMRRRTWDSFVDDDGGSIVTTDAVVIGDGPDASDCYKWAGTEFKTTDSVSLVIACGSQVTVENVTFDLYFSLNGQNLDVHCPYFGTGLDFTINTSESGAWVEVDCLSRGINFPLATGSGEFLFIQFSPAANVTAAAWQIRIDNIRVTLRTRAMKDELEWGDDYDDAPFDLDINLSDEFLKDFKFSEGGYDDFNAVAVVGGKQLESVEWIFDSDGTSRIVQLPAHIISRTVVVNEGNDTTPAWINKTEGIWGVDTLGGGIDYLYDPVNHWIYFAVASTPPNLVNAVRINGNIEVPFRLIVTNVSSDTTPIYATPIEVENVTSIEEATAIGVSALTKRASPRRMEFTTVFPLLKVGQKMTVVDSTTGMDETLVINRVQTRWIGASGHAEFTVYCGEQESIGMDTQMATTDKRARKKSALLNAGTITINPLIDEDDIMFVDETDEDVLEDDD